jgi:hypothetical protein
MRPDPAASSKSVDCIWTPEEVGDITCMSRRRRLSGDALPIAENRPLKPANPSCLRTAAGLSSVAGTHQRLSVMWLRTLSATACGC